MNERRHITLLLSSIAGVLLLGTALLIWPAHHELQRARAETQRLEALIVSLEDHEAYLERLTVQVQEEQRVLAEDLKTIPMAPDQAGLVRRLSFGVDGVRIREQTFTRGKETEAVPGDPSFGHVMPVTVDMEANFDSVFALIRAAETTERLVRVTSVRIEADREEGVVVPFLTASIGLDAVFDAPEGEMGP